MTTVVKLFGIGVRERESEGGVWECGGAAAAAGRKRPRYEQVPRSLSFVPLKSADNYLVKCTHDNSLIIAIQTALSRPRKILVDDNRRIQINLTTNIQ